MCTNNRTHYVFVMDIVYTILFTVLLVSACVRHIVRTLSFIEDYRLKVKNRLIERFKH